MTDHQERRSNDDVAERYETLLREVTARHEVLTSQTLNHIDERMILHIKPLYVALEAQGKILEEHQKAMNGNGSPGCRAILVTLYESVKGLLEREQERKTELRDIRVAIAGGFIVGILMWIWTKLGGA